ncbi:hypothetical protein [Hydrogenophaga sp.]|jgi:hypothetical protein|uniref:hypothetical protein n=1 Tax=Hydrogenophaga sp. TaxID=1904254 RepID=UPI002615585B|nr:hypothetical protein [Hydrogenophaga sp.]MDM7949003.1 hypothetical protein [Hydrogenophaga sp.]
MKKHLFVKSALALALAAPLLASAESQLTVGAGSAAANLDFRVIIPRVLFLAVGTGAAGLADNATVDTVTFDYTTNPAAVGTTAAAGAITGNVVPVRVLGNNGVIALASTNTGDLANGAGDTIPWSEITAVSSDAANFDSPAPSGASVNLGLSSGTRITSRTANWTFSYANTAVVAPGTYGTTNGRVTYTATMP